MIKRWITASTECIIKGIPCNGCDCPIALAIKPLVRDDVTVTVAFNYIVYSTENNLAEINNPLELGLFIIDVDRNLQEAFPMSFLIEMPEWAVK